MLVKKILFLNIFCFLILITMAILFDNKTSYFCAGVVLGLLFHSYHELKRIKKNEEIENIINELVKRSLNK